ncbi:hypothetical protein ISN44_As10g019230 [Arabidopsis suecica]|uniref:Uncharacterized protein n=1 Tax=Arabidopsis suecica TaxID=45249 RepID=A0A8T1ZY82_ARASU|nr:hypothetical protein ISN44_As10g019230 [Arabidopsis suecica]
MDGKMLDGLSSITVNEEAAVVYTVDDTKGIQRRLFIWMRRWWWTPRGRLLWWQNVQGADVIHILQCVNILKDEAAMFEELHHKFMKDKADHLQGLKVPKQESFEDLASLNYTINNKLAMSRAAMPLHTTFTERTQELERFKRKDRAFISIGRV